MDTVRATEALAVKESQVKLTYELDAARRCIRKALHLDAFKGVFGENATSRESPPVEWVVVYRTAQGFCCMYHDAPVEFSEMLDVQIWGEEMDVQTYFIGL
jgi:hypothetical protein